MAFKHISASRFSFLLTSDVNPTVSDLNINGEAIPIGSLAIDRSIGKLYQLKPNSTWQEVGSSSGGGASEVFEILTNASTSGGYTFNLGFNPTPNSVKLFVNGQLTMPFPTPNYHYTLSNITITWSNSAPYAIDNQDQLIVYYSTLDF